MGGHLLHFLKIKCIEPLSPFPDFFSIILYSNICLQQQMMSGSNGTNPSPLLATSALLYQKTKPILLVF